MNLRILFNLLDRTPFKFNVVGADDCDRDNATFSYIAIRLRRKIWLGTNQFLDNSGGK